MQKSIEFLFVMKSEQDVTALQKIPRMNHGLMAFAGVLLEPLGMVN